MRTVMTRMVFASALLLFSPGLVAAEPYAGLFVGAAITQDADVEDKLTPVTTFNDVGFDTSVVFGGKVEPYILERRDWRSEEHTAELQLRLHLVCRLLLEKNRPSRLCRS